MYQIKSGKEIIRLKIYTIYLLLFPETNMAFYFRQIFKNVHVPPDLALWNVIKHRPIIHSPAFPAICGNASRMAYYIDNLGSYISNEKQNDCSN